MTGVDELTAKLSGQFNAARERVNVMQETADERYRSLHERSQPYARATQRIKEILKPRIEAFASFFKGVTESVNQVGFGPKGGGFRGVFVAFEFSHTEQCPANITLRYSLDHDASIEHLILAYDLEMVPVFIPFKSHDELVLPPDPLDEAAVTGWFDRSAQEFTQTYLDMQFNPQYQKENLGTDPVLGVSFPLAFAVGSEEYGGRTFHFFTAASLHEFERNPQQYFDPVPSPVKASATS